MTPEELDYQESKERSVQEAAISALLLAGSAIVGFSWENFGWWGVAGLAMAIALAVCVVFDLTRAIHQ